MHPWVHGTHVLPTTILIAHSTAALTLGDDVEGLGGVTLPDNVLVGLVHLQLNALDNVRHHVDTVAEDAV